MKFFLASALTVSILFYFSFLIQNPRNSTNQIRKGSRSLLLKDDSSSSSWTGQLFTNPNADKRVIFNSRYMSDKYEASRNYMNIPKIEWENIVVMMLTYNNEGANMLIRAQLDTWVKKAGKGLDIVFVTDIDDVREDDEIVPNLDNPNINIHIYRSNAAKEGKRARSKVLDGFSFIEKRFRNDESKQWYLKIDPDSYVVPGELIKFLDDVTSKTYPFPVDFGNGICNNKVYCYSEGGLYGMNKLGFESAMGYLADHELEVLNEFVPPKVDPSRNTLDHEDSFTSYLFWKSTGYPTIWNRDVSIGNFDNEIKHQNPISIHPIKSYKEFYLLEKIFYDGDGNKRDISVSRVLLQDFNDYFEFQLLEWDYEKGDLVKKSSAV